MLIFDFIRILRQTRIIHDGNLPGLPNKALAQDYFWLKMKEFQRNFFKKEFNYYKSNLGFTIGFVKFETLLYLFNEIFVENQYYFSSQNENPLIIDCGSNVGMSILYFKTLYPKARIIGFEPFEPVYKILKENVERNYLENVSIFQFALSDREGDIEIFYMPDNPGSLSMSTLSERGRGNSLSVKSTLLSKYIDSNVDFLKVDIEGAELCVINELAQSGKIHFVQELLIEYHHHIKKHEDNLSIILSVLEDNNFGYQLVSPSNPPFQKKIYQDILIYAYKK